MLPLVHRVHAALLDRKGLSPGALADLMDLACDLRTALALADTDEADTLAWLRFSHDAHWGDHVQDVTPYLRWLS